MKSSACGTCKYFNQSEMQKSSGLETGYCHRFPPLHNPKTGLAEPAIIRPLVHETRDFCGEHEHAKK